MNELRNSRKELERWRLWPSRRLEKWIVIYPREILLFKPRVGGYTDLNSEHWHFWVGKAIRTIRSFLIKFGVDDESQRCCTSKSGRSSGYISCSVTWLGTQENWILLDETLSWKMRDLTMIMRERIELPNGLDCVECEQDWETETNKMLKHA